MVAHAIEDLSQTYKGDRRWRVEPLPITPPEPLSAMAGVLDRLAVLRAATLDAAQAGFAEDHLGRIAPGLRADFILLDRDPQLASAEELRQLRVLETWVNGRKVYEAGRPPAAQPVAEPTRGTGTEGR
jgi:cytosine/adenosine deaminase-related metal-dependent hydrolase